MKFKKILITGFEETELTPAIWKKIDALADKRAGGVQTDVDCLFSKFNPVSKEDIDNLPNLKYIGVLATGYGKVDTNYAKSKGIIVTNVPDYSTESVAELVFAVILEHLRDLGRAKEKVRDGDYSGSGFAATEIRDKTFGVLGLGRIGQRVAEIAQGFGANVIYWSKNRKKETENKGIKYEEIDTLLSKSDFLSLHLALNKETERFLNKDRLEKAKKGATIINTAPMELVDLIALENRLKNGDMTFILDHSDDMKEEDVKRLLQYKNSIIYPPIGYISEEAKLTKQEIFVSNIENFLKGSPINVMNP